MHYDILLIDANAIGYASMYQPALSKLSFGGQSTAALHGVPNTLAKVMRQHPEATPVLLWDGKADWRHALLPEYKANRSDTPEKQEIRQAYRQQVPILQQILTQAGMPQVRNAHAEADDLAGYLARHLSGEHAILLGGRRWTNRCTGTARSRMPR